MSDEEQGKKAQDNTGLEPKPENVQQDGYAPKGHLGHQPSTPSPGGTAQPRQNVSAVPTSPNQDKTQSIEDDRDVFFETDDPEVNADAQKTDRMIGKESPGHPDNKAQEQTGDGPQFSQSDYAKAFRQARDQERQEQQQQSKGIGLE